VLEDDVVLTDYWPMQGLRLTTPRLELRLPTDVELAELADLAARGVHDPAVMPFLVPWTDLPPVERGRSVLQWAWRLKATWAPQSWSLSLAVFLEGRIVGLQDVKAQDFSVLREVMTGSWVGLSHQGRGIGTEMRAAVLHLAFEGLGAEHATSAAHLDNAASHRVSAKLGYVDDGLERQVVRELPATFRRLRLTREQWLAHRTTPVSTHGLESCLPLFGVDSSRGQ
jgi:RimJ/RimL family protein N-acetyltransferase